MEETVIDDGVVMRNAVLSFTPPAPSRRSAAPAAAALEMPLNTSVAADSIVELTNTGERTVRYRVMPCELKDYTITFSPSSGTLKPRRSAKLKAKLTVRSKVNTNCRVTVHINDGASSHVVTAKIRCDTGVFGVDPATLEAAVDPDCGARVPVLLLNIKARLAAAGGLTSEGIFRLAGEQTELRAAKDAINRAATAAATTASSSSSSRKGDNNNSNGNNGGGRGGGPGCVLGCVDGLPEDVNDLATLIKIWYRELPQPLLNALPEARIVDSADVGACVAAVDALAPVSRALLDWLLDLLLRVAANRAVTKMTAQNLAIVIAPNLYEATTPDPVQGLVMSQKAVQFVHNLLIHMADEREKAAAAAATETATATTAAETEATEETKSKEDDEAADKTEAGEEGAKGKEKKKKSSKSKKGAKSSSVVLKRPKGKGKETGGEDEGGLSDTREDESLADSGRKSPHKHHHRRHHHAESVVLSPGTERRVVAETVEAVADDADKKQSAGAEAEEKRAAKEEEVAAEAQGASEAEEEPVQQDKEHEEHEEVCHALKQATVFVEVVDEDEEDEGEQSAPEGAEDTKGEAATEAAPSDGEGEGEKETEATKPQEEQEKETVSERKDETPVTTEEGTEAHGDPEQ